MSNTTLEGELARQVERLEYRYRETVVRLDRAWTDYYQLKVSAADPAQIASAEEQVVDLTDMRDAIGAELERLDDLRWVTGQPGAPSSSSLLGR